MFDVDRELSLMTWQIQDADGKMTGLEAWPVVVAKVQPGSKISKAILDAAQVFAFRTGIDPDVAYIREMPAGVPEFTQVRTATVTVADWVAPGVVVLGNTNIKRTVVQWQQKGI